MFKKYYFGSLIIIPLTIITLLLTLYLTKVWIPSPVAGIFIILLLLVIAGFSFFFLKDSYQRFDESPASAINFSKKQCWWKLLIIGFIADFCDTIGIGSFAVSVVLLKLTKQVHNDKRLFGIMNVGHSIPTCLEALIFIALIQVAWPTLVSLILAATIGAYCGAILANKIKLQYAQMVIGCFLLIVSIIMVCGQKQIGLMPHAGVATGFDVSWKYAVGIPSFFILGLLMALGIGIYAPAMATTYLLGLSAECAFPIMMGSAAFLMPVAGLRFIKDKNYEVPPALAFTLGGSLGVIIAYGSVFLFLQKGLGLNKEQFINVLLWIVIVVMWYTALTLIVSGIKKWRQRKPQLLICPAKLDNN